MDRTASMPKRSSSSTSTRSLQWPPARTLLAPCAPVAMTGPDPRRLRYSDLRGRTPTGAAHWRVYGGASVADRADEPGVRADLPRRPAKARQAPLPAVGSGSDERDVSVG